MVFLATMLFLSLYPLMTGQSYAALAANLYGEFLGVQKELLTSFKKGTSLFMS
jgi:hypothetical protein